LGIQWESMGFIVDMAREKMVAHGGSIRFSHQNRGIQLAHETQKNQRVLPRNGVPGMGVA
jgi:hypothetical protein